MSSICLLAFVVVVVCFLKLIVLYINVDINIMIIVPMHKLHDMDKRL